MLDDRSRCQPYGVRGGIPQEGLAAAAVSKPTVRTARPYAEQLAREKAFSGKTPIRAYAFSKTCEPCSLPSSPHFRESCHTCPSRDRVKPHRRLQIHGQNRL